MANGMVMAYARVSGRLDNLEMSWKLVLSGNVMEVYCVWKNEIFWNFSHLITQIEIFPYYLHCCTTTYFGYIKLTLFLKLGSPIH